MSATAEGLVSERPGGLSWLWRRQLVSYPNTGPRVMYLAITVVATVMLYYELYVGGSASTLILANLHMSFTFFVTTLAIGNLIGAFGSLFAGLTDRLGRANLVVFGLLFTGVFTTFILPVAPNKWAFTIEGFVVGVVEGICLVATPALIRDFSPQVGRATAMGFWTSGPVLGSLIVTAVGTATVPAVIAVSSYRHVWAHEYVICGIAGLVVFVIALIALRELSPQLRDQLMVTMHDRALIEMRAQGLDIESALRHPFRQLLKADVIISAIAVSVMLLIYYTAVGFAVIFLNSVFGFSVKDANGLGNWNWGFNVFAVILVGVISDRFRVRKPFMVAGGVAAVIMTIIYLLEIGLSPSYYTLAIILALLSFSLGIAYTPWMASFTETVEAHNPALTATGLAIWGWIIRVVVCAAFLVIPHVVTTVTPLVQNGPTAQAYLTQYPVLNWARDHPVQVSLAQKYKTQLGYAVALQPELTALQKNVVALSPLLSPSYTTPSAVPKTVFNAAVAAAGGGTTGTTIADAIITHHPQIFAVIKVQGPLQALAPYGKELLALSKVPPSVTHYMSTTGVAVGAALAKTGSQWKHWYWICVGGIIFFLLSVPLLRGRWSSIAARRDEAEHEAMVDAELAAMHA